MLRHSQVLAVLVCASTCLAQKDADVDALVVALGKKDAHESHNAGIKLEKLGKAAVPTLVARLKSEKRGSELVNRIAVVLGHMEADGTGALPTLLALLDTGTIASNKAIVGAIDGIAPYAPDKHTAIETAMADAYYVKKLPVYSVAFSKIRLTVNIRLSTTELLKTLEEGNSLQREVAARLLVESEGNRAEKVAALTRCFERKVGEESIATVFRGTAVRCAAGTGCNNRDQEKLAIALALARLASPKDVPETAWVEILRHHDPAVLRRAIHAVGLARTSSAVPGLIKLTEFPDRVTAWEAITILGTIGADAKKAIPTLERLATSKDKATSVRAAAALAAIKGSKPK